LVSVWTLGGVSVLGVDGCCAGWVGVWLSPVRVIGLFGANLTDLLTIAERHHSQPDVVAIDMPIGLPDGSGRQSDTLARTFVGPGRGSSVFPTPVRAVLAEGTYEAACQRSVGLIGKALSKQSFALRPRLIEVDAWVRRAGVPVIEVHPEVSFAEMAGRPVEHSKHRPEGLDERRQLLLSEGIRADRSEWGLDRLAKEDDVLDAAAAAWTARRFSEGRAIPLPDPPEVFSDGLPSAIWR